MQKLLLCSLILFSGLQAEAGLGVGLLGSLQKDTWVYSSSSGDSISSSKTSNRLGFLLWLPILPTLTLRTGYLMETQDVDYKSPSLSSSINITYKNHAIPLNLQFDLPLVGLYAFGGMLFVDNDSTSSSISVAKNSSDLRYNLGAGYEMFTLGIVQINAELEYQQGTRNIASGSSDLKVNALDANLLFRIGF